MLVYEILVDICEILGVDYDENILNSKSDLCDKVDYLLNQIYKYLGGE